MTAPATARPWHEFRARNVDPARIAGGVKFWREHAALLDRAAQQFGVPAELIVATIGIETIYGRTLGTFRVIDALVTLGFHHPTRGEFFRGELEQFLLLAREERLDARAVRGSYAGAIGIPQFLPGSYRKYAVDFNADGRRDLVSDAADAIGSVASYYRSFGWKAGAAVVVPVEADATGVDAVIAAGIKPHTRVGELRARGITPLAAADDAAEAALFSVETASGTRYFLGLDNFYVITRYNRSVNYAMAVHELAAEIRNAMTAGAGTAP